MKIVIYDQLLPIGEDVTAAIRQVAPSATVVVPPEDQLSEQLKDAEIFFGYYGTEVFHEAKKLKWIQATAAGMEQFLDEGMTKLDLTITNASGVHAIQVAESAWALTMAIARGLPTYLRQQQEHVWKWGSHYDLADATAGIVGMGGIGRCYARVAAALGMQVIAVDAHSPPKPDEVEAIWKLDQLDQLLETADVVLMSCPHTPETHHLIDRRRLALMKPTAILVNIARGGIVDEEALAEALRAGRLAGAGIDVCEEEPLPPESPLWDVPNLIITPHCAGLSSHRTRRLTKFFCENLQCYLAGESLRNVVDQVKGYPIPTG